MADSLAGVRNQIAVLAERILRIENRATLTPRTRRGAAGLTNLAVGVTEVDVTWSPFPDDTYHADIALICGQAALPNLRAGLKPGSKTRSGCTVLVVNTGLTEIAAAAVDVLATR